VRRIEAIAGPAVLYLQVRERIVRELSDVLRLPEELPERITGLQNELRTTQKQLETSMHNLPLPNLKRC